MKWNFTKFLVSRNGTPVKRYSPTTNPLSLEKDILEELSKPAIYSLCCNKDDKRTAFSLLLLLLLLLRLLVSVIILLYTLNLEEIVSLELDITHFPNHPPTVYFSNARTNSTAHLILTMSGILKSTAMRRILYPSVMAWSVLLLGTTMAR